MTSAQYSEVRDLGVRLSGCWDPVGVEGFLWKDLKAPQVDGGVRASARDAAQQAQDRAATLATVATRASLTSVGMGCEGPGAAAVLLRLVEHLGTPGTRPPNEWLWKVPLPEVIARIHALRELAAERHDAATRAERIAGARWHEVSPGLARALNTALEVLARRRVAGESRPRRRFLPRPCRVLR